MFAEYLLSIHAHQPMKILHFATLAFLLMATACHERSCSDEPRPNEPSTTRSAIASPLSEGFETGTKTSYATGNATLGTGTWVMNDALLGNSSSDKKTGTRSARLRNSGKISMMFDKANGASTISVAHASYGTDAPSTWQLWYSSNGGSSYTQNGNTVTSSPSLTTATFTINISGSIRIEVRKADGSTNRLNIDNIAIADYTTTGPPPGTAKRFLFDASQGQTAGNADWVIDQDNSNPQRTPTPAQSTITSATAESYWTGGISAWGIALAKGGHLVETLPSSGIISFGNTSNLQDLSNYDVFVVDEPNIVFTAAEKTAILRFVQTGGGLVMVADHDASDRNNDGWDSPRIWNDLMSNNTVQANPFGFSIDATNLSGVTSNRLGSTTNPILNGTAGAVSQLSFNNGASLTLSPASNSAVQGLIWQSSSTQSTSNVWAASSTFGTGRVFVLTDSSPTDDGTGAPGNTLYAGWSGYSHSKLLLNASYWAAGL